MGVPKLASAPRSGFEKAAARVLLIVEPPSRYMSKPYVNQTEDSQVETVNPNEGVNADAGEW